MGFHHIGQAGLELLTSSVPPASASQSAGITSVSHSAQSQTPSAGTHAFTSSLSAQSGFLFLSFFFETEFRSCYPGWSAMA